MNYHKKAAAFAISLLICLNVTPVFAYADNEENINHDDEIMLIDEDDSEIPVATTDTSDSLSADGFTYTVDDDGFAHITGCTLTDTDISIPESLDGIKVTEIEAGTFEPDDSTDSTIEKLHIPATIEYISSENPFAPCLNLKEITIDENNENYCVNRVANCLT